MATRFKTVVLTFVLASTLAVIPVGLAAADSHCPSDPQTEGGYGQPSPPTDWHGCDLSNLQLSYVNLTGTDLTGANLSNTTLFGASLAGAKIEGINLAGARFDGGTMFGAIGTPADANATYNGTRCPDGFDTRFGWPPDTPPDTCIGHFLPIVDGDGDGVADAIGTGIAGGFDDGEGTSGSIVATGGLAVLVEDAAAPDGVRITASGSGGPAVIHVCGFTVNLSQGSDATVTCGSVIVRVMAGEATVLLTGTDHVTIPPGGGAEVDLRPDGTVIVESFFVRPVVVTIRGVTQTVNSGETAVFTADADNDGIVDSVDVCPGTVLPDVPTLGLKGARFAARSDGVFVSGMPALSGLYRLTDTRGCSGTQIIELRGLGDGHTRYGISKSELEKFIGDLNRS